MVGVMVRGGFPHQLGTTRFAIIFAQFLFALVFVQLVFFICMAGVMVWRGFSTNWEPADSQSFLHTFFFSTAFFVHFCLHGWGDGLGRLSHQLRTTRFAIIFAVVLHCFSVVQDFFCMAGVMVRERFPHRLGTTRFAIVFAQFFSYSVFCMAGVMVWGAPFGSHQIRNYFCTVVVCTVVCVQVFLHGWSHEI